MKKSRELENKNQTTKRLYFELRPYKQQVFRGVLTPK